MGFVDLLAAADPRRIDDLQGNFAKIAGTGSGQGASLVGLYGGGTLQDFAGAYVLDADTSGVVDVRTAVVVADTAAAAAGQSLVIPPGTYLIGASTTFTARIVMRPGAKFKVTAAGAYLKFGAGFDAGLYYCLDTDQPTQFLAIEKILPQWFGVCGGVSEDSTVPLMRAYRAARGCTDASTSTPDKSYGCRTVYIAPGVYKGENVLIYSGTITRGEWQGSLFGSTLAQKTQFTPLFRVVPKNYSVNGTLINDGVGQNYFENVGFLGKATFATDGGAMIHFMSVAQATAYLADGGVTTDGVNHVDTMFSHCWFKDAPTCIYCDDSVLQVHIKDCVFDVVERAIRHTGTARGSIRSYNTFYYGCIWGAFVNDITSINAVDYVNWSSVGDEFVAGNTQEANATRTRSVYYFPTNEQTDSRVVIKSLFRKTTALFGSRVGGLIYMRNVEYVDLDVGLIDPDNLVGSTKAIFIGDGIEYLSLRGSIVSKSLQSYTNSRLVVLSQSVPVWQSIKIQLSVTNENASTVVSGIYSDFVLANIDLTGTVMRGSFTQEVESTVSRPFGYARKGSTVYDPPSIAADGTATTTVTVAGARLGDFAEASFSLSLAGLTLTAYVSASDIVTVVLHNPTAGAINLASGTLSALAQRSV